MTAQPGAHCVITKVNNTDVACAVHIHYVPCPRDGEPASPVAMHTDSVQPRDDVLAYWREVTDEQRPLVIHAGSFGDARLHLVDEGDGDRCWCGPELIIARQYRTEPVVKDIKYTGGAA